MRDMRVIAGRLRHAELETPRGMRTRPITDRVKESLFNILGHRFGTLGHLPDIAVLDLFAGSGALGIECLSRGACTCLFVEHDRRALRTLRANITRLGLADSARIARENAWTMRVPPAAGDGYGLVFVDPPYRDLADPLRMVDLLERLVPRLSPQGLAVLRHATSFTFSADRLEGLTAVDDRVFGMMRILLLQRAADAR